MMKVIVSQRFPGHGCTGFLFGAAVMSFMASAGCSPVQTRFDVLSFKESSQRALFSEQFPAGAFCITAHRNTGMVFELLMESDRPVDVAVPTPVDPNRTSQTVRIEVFWRPRPGTTYADSTQTNAQISYCLVTGPHAVTYEGAGFVFLRPSRDGKTLSGEVESATLVPAHFSGDAADLFGPCHLRGTFTAREDRARVVRAEKRLKRSRVNSPPSN
jgi:hypothetical protein